MSGNLVCNVCLEEIENKCAQCGEDLDPKSFICLEDCNSPQTKHFCSESCCEEHILEVHQGYQWEAHDTGVEI